MSETETCETCDGPCVCADLDGFLTGLFDQTGRVPSALRVTGDMFDVGTAKSLKEGDALVHFSIHPPGEHEDTDANVLTLVFGKLETYKLISLLIRGFQETWGSETDE